MRQMRRSVALACVLAGLTAGCSASYSGERLFWRAEQLTKPLLQQTSPADPERVTQAIHAFEQVIPSAPGTVWAARAQLSIGSLEAMQQRYDNAREAYALVL